jgi:hypothetical protein
MLGARGTGAEEAEQGGASERAREPILKWNVNRARRVTLVVGRHSITPRTIWDRGGRSF